MKLVKPTILTVALFITVNSFAQKTKIIVSKDQKFKVESVTNMNSSAEVMGQSMESTVDNKTTTLVEVTDVDRNEIKLKSTITNMVATSNSMGQQMSFDSDKKDNSGAMADMLSPKINKARKIVIDEKGSVIKREGDDMGDDGQMAMMGLPVGDESVIELFISALIGRELKAGDVIPGIVTTAKDKFNSKDSGTYTVTSVENGIASISYTGTQIVNATVEQMGMEMQTTSNNAVKSELQMDINTCLVLLRATVIEMNVTIDVGGISIPATGKTTVTTKITPVQ